MKNTIGIVEQITGSNDILFGFFKCPCSKRNMAGVCSEGNVSSLMCCVNYVKENGVCKECALGYYGVDCHIRCPDNYFGRLCKQKCNCIEEYICHFENGCISSVSNENKEGTLGTLELIGILSIGSLITVVIISLLLCIIKNLSRRKKVTENVDALMNLLRPHLRSDHHSYTPCDTNQDEQGAVGGSALVPVVKDGCMRKSVNEYSTIETLSHYHTLSSVSKWRRSRSPAIHNVLRKSISLTGMDSIEFVHEEKKSVFSNNAAYTTENTIRHSEVFFTKGRRSVQDFAIHFKRDFEPSDKLEDESSPCEQDIPNRDKIKNKYEFNEIGENWNSKNNANECNIEVSDVDAHSDSEREYSKLNHLYGKPRSRSLRKGIESIKDTSTRGCSLNQCGESKETSENSQLVVPENSDMKGKKNRELCQNDSTGAPSGFEFHNDNETSFTSVLPDAKRHDESTAMETQFQSEKSTMSNENKHPSSFLHVGEESNSTCKNTSVDSNQFNSETRGYHKEKEYDPGYEYGMVSETDDPNTECSAHFRQVDPSPHSVFRPYSVVNKSNNMDHSTDYLKLLNETLTNFPSARPYSVVAKKKEREGKNSQNDVKFEHENSGFATKKSNSTGQNAFTERTVCQSLLPDVVLMNESTHCEGINCDTNDRQNEKVKDKSKAYKKKKVKPSTKYFSMKRKVPNDISPRQNYTMKDDDYLYEDYNDSPKEKDKHSLRNFMRKMSSSSKQKKK